MAPTATATSCPTSWRVVKVAWRRSRRPGNSWKNGPGSRPPRRPLDVRQAVPMVDQARANLDASGVKDAIKAMLGDAGYSSETNATDLEQRGIEAYLATERLKHHEKVASAPRGRIPVGLSAKQRMARKLRTKAGREMYAKRKGMIEPIFGQLKQALGFRQFLMRGLSSVRGEW